MSVVPPWPLAVHRPRMAGYAPKHILVLETERGRPDVRRVKERGMEGARAQGRPGRESEPGLEEPTRLPTPWDTCIPKLVDSDP